MIEEDQLDPFDRLRTSYAKYRWRRQASRPPGASTAVFLVGLQRSGTNMILRGLERAPQVEVHNENDRRVFHDYRLRSDATVREVIARSRHQVVLFKPLCDSHRTPALLDLVAGDRTRAIWAYRHVDPRVRSSLVKFGAANLLAVQAIAAGDAGGRWEAGGLSEPDLELIRSLGVDGMDAPSASALFWYLRNKLFFDLALDRDPRVALAGYEGFLSRPVITMRRVCEHIGFPYRDELVRGIEPARPGPGGPLQLDPRVRALCEELQRRLTDHAASMYGQV